ncbi:hypothetical protein BKA66DRAFT_575294 [Pyrenochaeta sp. MPI-SDFR-AT-0127]|nr:hypothetical protein BKA66DRAFT_575294 [Pyrenochaeta sp. MPI-SDFR-AT-0127]
MPPQNESIWKQITEIPVPNVRKRSLLLYLWKLVPGTTDALHHPSYQTKRQLYEKFLEDCKKTSIPAVFRPVFKCHGYPFDANNTLATESGQAWAKALAVAAIVTEVGVMDITRKTQEEISREVAAKVACEVFDEWPPVMDSLFKEAYMLRKAELREEEEAKAKGPQRFDGEPNQFVYPQ